MPLHDARAEGEPRGMVIAHVDDVMISYMPGDTIMKEKFGQVRELYEWGMWESQEFKQTGGRVRQHYDTKTGPWGAIHLVYEEYIEQIQQVNIPSQRKRTPTEPLTPAE